MNLKKSCKKGFTLIELVLAIGISLILFSAISTMLSHMIKTTQNISSQEFYVNELYFFENFVRDEICSASKIEKNGTNTFILTIFENNSNGNVSKKNEEKQVYYYLNNGKIIRGVNNYNGGNTLISNVKNYQAVYENSYVKLFVELFTGQKREIIVEVRAEEL